MKVKLHSMTGSDLSGTLVKGQYSNGRTALSVINKGEPQATLTQNLVQFDCPEDEAWFKTYSENTGFLKQLVDQKIISEPTITIVEHVAFKRCKILVKLK